MKSNSLIAATPLHPRNMVRSALVLAGALALWTGVAGLAQAHVTLAPEQAAPGARLDAVLRVPHGCSGAATTELRVLVPSGVLDVQLQPKAGWDAKFVARESADSEGPAGELSWQGELPNDAVGEFAFSAQLAPELDAGQTLYFPAVQRCGEEVERWIQTSDDEDHAKGRPAPRLQLLAPVSASDAN